MRRYALSLVAALLALPAVASWEGHRGLSISTDDETPITTCDQIHVRYNGRSVPVVSEEVPVGGARSLRVRTSTNGGIHVSGTSSSGYSVTACKASSMGDVSNVRVNVSGNEVSGTSEERGDVLYFIVRTPRGADLNLSSNNGPIGISGVDGSVVARAQNGPIALKDSTGDLDMGTQNGPIAFSGNAGRVKLHATNGPISIHLKGAGWDRGSLDAETENGPLALKLPRDYRSGVTVDTDGNSPVSCRAEGCMAAMKAMSRNDDDDNDFRWPRHIDLGTGAKAITLTTHNGPVAIKESSE